MRLESTPVITDPPVKLLNVLRLVAIIGLLSVVSIVILVEIQAHESAFHATAQQLRRNHVEQQRQIVRREVERVVDRIEYRRSILNEVAVDLARGRVLQAEEMVRNMRDEASLADWQGAALSALAALRYDGGQGYLFVLDLKGQFLAHGVRPEYVGQNFATTRDADVRMFIQQLLDIARQDGEGRLIYDFDKPGQPGQPFPKIAFVKRIPCCDWIIASGVYLDELEEQEKRTLLAEIQQIRYGTNGYLFIDNWEGLVLAHGGQPELVGTNIWNFEDSQGVKVVQNLIRAAQTEHGDFVDYRWRKPDTGEERSKISFAKGVPEWRWMIGTGVYIDDIEQDIVALQVTWRRELQQSLLYTALAAAALAILLFLVITHINRLLLGDFARFQAFFNQAVTCGQPIDKATLRYQEFHDQADFANRMLADKLDAMMELRTLNASLEHKVAERTAELRTLNAELDRLATTDTLTGMWNRRYFEQAANAEIARVDRYSHPLSLILFDIDHFKAINDRHGHLAGDQVLIELAERVRRQLRVVDVLARWGGEEFVAMLPHCGMAEAVRIAEKLRALVAATPFLTVGTVTSSFGVAEFRPDEDLGAWVNRTDEALYAAKAAGRNAVRQAGTDRNP